MYSYICGIVEQIEGNFIILENNKIGFQIFTPNPYSFELKSEVKVYVYQQIREDEQTLYGFKTEEEKKLFLRLIEVKGLGCKMALPILATGSISGIVDAIERENILYLKKFPKIGDKIARQMILDLKGKLVSTVDSKVNHQEMDELIEVLKGLGYKSPDIMRIIPNIDKNKTIEEQIKDSLKMLLK